MDKVIKEGTLRLLITESTCDVILSCRDHRLMAHKLVLSIASPVFRELFRKNSLDSTSVLILPDINSSTMSTILDYIYTGTTVIYSHALEEFLSVTKFLEIVVDTQKIEKNLEYVKKHDGEDLVDCSSKKTVEAVNTTKSKDKSEKMEHKSKDSKVSDTKNIQISEQKYSKTKPQKRLPDLLPIDVGMFRKDVKKKMCNVVVPSPWCQRDGRSFLGDPRIVSLGNSDNDPQKTYLEDTNNNYQLTCNRETSKHNSKSLDTVIRHLYLSNTENRREKTSESTEKSQSDKSLKIGENTSSVPDFKSIPENLIERQELPKFTNFPFSRHLTDLLPFDLKNHSSHNDLSNYDSSFRPFNLPKEKDLSKKPVNSLHNIDKPLKKYDYILENYRKNSSLFPKKRSASFAQSSPTSELISSLHSSTLSSQNLSIDGESMNTEITEREQVCNDTLAVSNESSNSNNDVANENFNDNSISSDSSNDEKKEENESIKKKAFKCEDCGKTFSQLRNYKYHRSVHEGTKEFSAKCPECGKTFNDRGYLSSHMKIHRDRKEYACPNCPKRFNQRVAYNMHLRIHTGVKPHECPTCGKSFSRKMLLKQHQRVHTGERPYSCPECGKTFADRSNMSLHARLHTGVKPYACTICPKSFTKKHHLKTHMNFHTGLKPYSCENCGLAFSQSSNMRTHYKKCVLKDKLGNSAKTESLSSADNFSS